MSHKFHGIQLAAGSTADNFHFERVSATPAPLSYGRIWFNTTDKTFNFSDLDAGGAVRVNTFGSSSDLLFAIDNLTVLVNAEATRATAAEQAEVAARVAAVDALNTALATEVSTRTSQDAVEAAARIAGLATEAQNRTDAIAVAAATAANATATETAARLAGDAALNTRVDGVQVELDAVEAGLGLNTDGTFTAPENTTYLGTATTLKDAAVKLDTAIVAEAAARVGEVASLTSALANESQLRADGDANLQSQLTAWVNTQLAANAQSDVAETAARVAGDSALQTELDLTQATIGTAPDGSLIPISGTHFLDSAQTVFGGAFILDTQVYNTQQALAGETTARETADANFSASLATETAARIAGDLAVQTELNTTQSGAGLETDGTYAAGTDTNYLNAATSLKDADHKLDAAVKAVADRATAIESTTIPELQAQVTAEVNRATLAEAGLTSAIAGLSGSSSGALAAEVAARESGDEALQVAINDEAGRALAAETGLQTQLNALSAAAGDGANALKTTLNGKRYTYQSAAPALVHNVAHGLGTLFFSADLLVQGSDSVWRNDIAPLEIVDSNNFTITLTEACNIAISGQSNAQL